MKLLRRICLLLLLLAALCCAAAAADHTAEDLTQLYEIMLSEYEARTEEFSVEYTGNGNDLLDEEGMLRSCAALTREMAATLPCYNGKGPDIHMMNLESAVLARQGSTLTFFVEYLLDQEQHAFMEKKAAEIVDSLGVRGKSDYRKVKAVYEYMTTHFLYDQTLSQFTDYEGVTTGTMVCQGYALLTYRLLWELNIPCRIITGFSMGQPHGWNLVRVNGKWYSMDTTWDSRTESAAGTWNYFLHAPAVFVSHDAAEPFLSQTFREEHPFASDDYRLPTVTILVDDELFGSLIIRNGRSIRLTTQVEPATERDILWESSDPSVVSIDRDGNIESLRPGSVTITARVAGDDRYVAGTFPVSAVDTDSCSAWAHEELNSYYMRTLYPAEFCSNYGEPITREEFAQLIYLLLGEYHYTGGSFLLPDLQDIAESPYWLAIAYTVARQIFEGTGETAFSPTAPLTREQAAKALCAAMEHMGIELPRLQQASFTDHAAISPWAAEYVQLAADAGLFLGDGSGAFNPREPLTREQAAVLLERIVVQYIEPNLPAEEAA